jgi:hypothetical protein
MVVVLTGFDCITASAVESSFMTNLGEDTNSDASMTCDLPPKEGDMAFEKVNPSRAVMLKDALGKYGKLELS